MPCNDNYDIGFDDLNNLYDEGRLCVDKRKGPAFLIDAGFATVLHDTRTDERVEGGRVDAVFDAMDVYYTMTAMGALSGLERAVRAQRTEDSEGRANAVKAAMVIFTSLVETVVLEDFFAHHRIVRGPDAGRTVSDAVEASTIAQGGRASEIMADMLAERFHDEVEETFGDGRDDDDIELPDDIEPQEEDLEAVGDALYRSALNAMPFLDEEADGESLRSFAETVASDMMAEYLGVIYSVRHGRDDDDETE